MAKVVQDRNRDQESDFAFRFPFITSIMAMQISVLDTVSASSFNCSALFLTKVLHEALFQSINSSCLSVLCVVCKDFRERDRMNSDA